MVPSQQVSRNRGSLAPADRVRCLSAFWSREGGSQAQNTSGELPQNSAGWASEAESERSDLAGVGHSVFSYGIRIALIELKRVTDVPVQYRILRSARV